ncbi:hypothetical protein K0M31_010094 [Melipona bicolor]|uniref:Glutaredoxin domain-containing protein n=1 Tax=Melipona bicolor TaxID=60889 RepID=A0AA40KIV8_9HYME|nr:hypothetical protein K0M31_010094 [Melipona bicolor]
MKKELGKVVVYTTTSGIVRKTFYNCKKVKQILRTHMVKYDELDLFGDAELQTELRDRLGSTVIQLPQLFIDGQHIGGFDTVERLNESGELRDMLKPYQSMRLHSPQIRKLPGSNVATELQVPIAWLTAELKHKISIGGIPK